MSNILKSYRLTFMQTDDANNNSFYKTFNSNFVTFLFFKSIKITFTLITVKIKQFVRKK